MKSKTQAIHDFLKALPGLNLQFVGMTGQRVSQLNHHTKNLLNWRRTVLPGMYKCTRNQHISFGMVLQSINCQSLQVNHDYYFQ